ncbi:MAG: formate-dependent phosphoribosylglycinamide formyltransferase [Thioalkalivibrionaceae bacterium]
MTHDMNPVLTAASSMSLGTPGTASATRVLLLGAGELGKEVAIALARLGVEVIAADRYANAPAMQVAHASEVLDMLDAEAVTQLIERWHPLLVVPEVEAIATQALVELERRQAVAVIPTARAVELTMNREGIRRLAAETLGLPTSAYRFADDWESFLAAVDAIGLPCFVKPVMSSSGKGQSLVRDSSRLREAWDRAQTGGRAGGGRVIVEAPVVFDYEITLLTVRHVGGTSFCPPIGHVQVDGDYRESWQPQPMSPLALQRAQAMAQKVTEALSAVAGGDTNDTDRNGAVAAPCSPGFGVFGVELFVRGDEVWFSEVSPRPHDTGLVTLMSQNLSEFELHARAILGLPVPTIALRGPGASVALVGEGHSDCMRYAGVAEALSEPDTDLRLFGKPTISGYRRLGVALATAPTVDEARTKARRVHDAIRIEYGP